MNVKIPNSRGRVPLSLKIEEIMAFLQKQNASEPVLVRMPAGSFTDALIVAGSTSGRHARGLADGIGRLCHEKGYEFCGMEGYDAGEWILVDCNELVINIFLEDVRAMYRLEELWSQGTQSKEEKS